jgi:hypothetical protein
MKISRSFRKVSSLSLVLMLVLMISAAAWLPITGTPSEAVAGKTQLAALGSNADIVCVEVIHSSTAAASSGRTAAEYVLTGFKWPANKLPIAFAVNTNSIPENSSLSPTQAKEAIMDSAETWDSATSIDLFVNNVSNTATSYGKYDGINTIAFGKISNSSTIAVTMYWFNRSTRALLEFDMMFNTTYAWDVTDNQSTGTFMDLQNIATHEFGHTFGLGDLYKDRYKELTMYGYADYNQTNKIDLAAGDIAGLQYLYGQ